MIAHGVLYELMKLCESSGSVVTAHGVLSDALAAAGSFPKANVLYCQEQFGRVGLLCCIEQT